MSKEAIQKMWSIAERIFNKVFIDPLCSGDTYSSIGRSLSDQIILAYIEQLIIVNSQFIPT